MEEEKAASSRPLTPLVAIQSGEHPGEWVADVDTFKLPTSQVSFPVFVTGSRGKSTLMEGVAGSEVSFESPGEGWPDGVYMHCVSLGGTSLILLKFRREVEEASGDLRRRVRAVFMALSSIWCICEESHSATLEAMDDFAQDYALIRAQCDVEISKVFVFVMTNWYKRPQDRNALNAKVQKYPDLFQVLYRGDKGSQEDKACIAAFAAELTERRLHGRFQRSHPQGNFSGWYRALLIAFIKIANLDVFFDKFVSKLPNLRVSEEAINAILSRYKKEAERVRSVKSASALNFIVQKDVGGANLSPVFDETILELLQDKCQLNKPLVVISVMGPPGYGKSTMLNYFLQFCTESPKPFEIFKTGNTVFHTTRNSQVLSCPLYYKGHQIMLIDLEGLGGVEIGNEAMALAQQNLIRAIMTISSVVIRIEGNELAKLEKLKKEMCLLAELHQNFHFQYGRVYILFHDKKLEAGENLDYTREVETMNRTLFGNREIVKMLNKPMFPAVDEETRSRFAQTLLDDCLHTKLYEDGTTVMVQGLLSTLSMIARHQSTNLAQLMISRAEQIEQTRVAQEIIATLKNEAAALTSEDDEHLVCYFEEILKSKIKELNLQLANKSEGFRILCRNTIELEMNILKAELISYESCYGMIKTYPINSMSQVIDQLVTYRYNSAWTYVGFRNSMSKLGVQLRRVKAHFPRGGEKLDALIRCYEREQGWKTAEFAINTTAKVVCLLTPPTAVLAGLGTVVIQACAKLTMRTAFELLYVNSMWGNGNVNPAVLKYLTRNPCPYAPVLLLIGSEATRITAFANQIIGTIATFTEVETNAFHPNTYTQILFVDYYHRSTPKNTISRASVICLRMEDRAASKYAQTMLKIAKALLPAASLTCLLSDHRNEYAGPLLDHLSSGPSQQPSPLPERCVLVLHSNDPSNPSDCSSLEQMSQRILRVKIEHALEPIKDFTDETIAACMEDIQHRFNAVQARPSSVLQERINALPAAMRA